MSLRIFYALCFCVAPMNGLSTVAFAAFNSFTDQSVWESAVGTPIETEDFNSITNDISIVDAPVTLNNMTVFGMTTFQNGEGALIEAPPYDGNDFYSFDGSSYLTTIIRGPVDFVRFDFERPISAWGADTKGVSNGGRITDILVYDASDTLLGTIHPLTPLDPLNPNNQDPFPLYESFYGFSLTGTPASYVIWANNGFGDAFGIDNIVFVAVPEPSALLIILSASVALAATRYSPSAMTATKARRMG